MGDGSWAYMEPGTLALIGFSSADGPTTICYLKSITEEPAPWNESITRRKWSFILWFTEETGQIWSDYVLPEESVVNCRFVVIDKCHCVEST